MASDNIRISDLMDGTYSASVHGYDEDDLTGPEASTDFHVEKEISSDIPEAIADVSVEVGKTRARAYWNGARGADYYEVSLSRGTDVIYDTFATPENSVEIDSTYLGAALDISVVSRNAQNNGSEAFTKTISLFDDTDEDKDGLPDMWEDRYLGGLAHSGAEDSDLDGLTNAEEYTRNTHPLKSDTDNDQVDDKNDPNPLSYSDENRNHVPDDWESFYNITDILGDDDGDGYANHIEYQARLKPNQYDDTELDVSQYQDMNFSPVIVSNVDEISVVKQHENVTIDLSSSFDINGNDLTFTWKVNGDSVESTGSTLSLDTGETGMYRVEVWADDGDQTAYRKYSVFVADGECQKVTGGQRNIIELGKYKLTVPKAAMQEGSYLVAGDISLANMPVGIMGREIVTDGVAYFYSESYKLESPITITPYVKDDDEIDPYIFNYSTSVWTNIYTGETFEPVFRKRTSLNTDESYTLSTKETGILVFARRPEAATLSPVMKFDSGSRIFHVDMEAYMQENGLTAVEDVSVSNPGIVRASSGYVTGDAELRLDIGEPGLTEITVTGTDDEGNKTEYSYLVEVGGSYAEKPGLGDVILGLRICAGMSGHGIHPGADSDGDETIGIGDVISLLQAIATEQLQ